MTRTSRKKTTWRWTKQRLDAARFSAAGTLADSLIAEKLGIARSTLARWQERPEFQAKIAEHLALWDQEINAHELAEKDNRVEGLNDRWFRMRRVIEERAETYKDDPEAAPGAHTGLLVKRYKTIGYGKDTEKVIEWAVDTGLLSEMRATEKQAAQELGQWSERSTITVDLENEIQKVADELGVPVEEVRADMAQMMEVEKRRT